MLEVYDVLFQKSVEIGEKHQVDGFVWTIAKKFKKTLKNPQPPLKQRHKTILIKNKNGLKSIVKGRFF